jgi:hypothetical protein
MVGLTLLDQAKSAGLTVLREGDRLIVRGPKRLASLAQGVLAHKEQVLAALEGADALAEVSRPFEDHHEAWEERAAIMEFEGGLPREEAERRAVSTIAGIDVLNNRH